MGNSGCWRRNVAAVIMDSAGNVLLGSKSVKSRYLHFPQGGVRKKESLETAVRREIWEEVGLPESTYRILLRLGGLRYHYRQKNAKSARWRGQEQTYFLMLCDGVMPETDTSHSPEFASVVWIPRREIRAEMFVPFKRKVVERVLNHLFPQEVQDIDAHLSSLSALESMLYQSRGGLVAHDPGDRTFFAGGKEEVNVQMLDLGRSIIHSQRRGSGDERLLVVLLGSHGSARDNCLRHLAPCLDPLLSHIQTPAEGLSLSTMPFVESLGGLVPRAGEILVLARSSYDGVVQEFLAADTETAHRHAESLSAFESLLQAEGVKVLKCYLNISPPEQEKMYTVWEAEHRAAEQLLSSTCGSVPWYIIPSDRRWYRNYMIISLIRDLLGESS